MNNGITRNKMLEHRKELANEQRKASAGWSEAVENRQVENIRYFEGRVDALALAITLLDNLIDDALDKPNARVRALIEMLDNPS